MGILPDNYKSADFGIGYGFVDQEDAMNSIDHADPPLGKTFKINGAIYKLVHNNDRLEFEDINK